MTENPGENSNDHTEHTGSYSVVFELWQYKDDGTLVFTQNYCVLKIQVIN